MCITFIFYLMDQVRWELIMEPEAIREGKRLLIYGLYWKDGDFFEKAYPAKQLPIVVCGYVLTVRTRSNSFVRNRSLQKRRLIPISLPMNSRSMAEKPHGIVPRFRSYSITSTASPYAMSRAKQTVCRSVWPPPGSTLPATEVRKPHPSRTGRHAPQGMKQP